MKNQLAGCFICSAKEIIDYQLFVVTEPLNLIKDGHSNNSIRRAYYLALLKNYGERFRARRVCDIGEGILGIPIRKPFITCQIVLNSGDRIMRGFWSIILVLGLIISGCSEAGYINTKDGIPDSDEKIIKEFRAHHNYSQTELYTLGIRNLGEVDGFRIYFVLYKEASSVSEESWSKGGFVFPSESHTQILGVKEGDLYTLGNLLFETSINVEKLHDLIPGEK